MRSNAARKYQNLDYIAEFRQMIAKLASIRIDPASITVDSSFATDLVFDSIGLVSLLALCEERFGVDLEGSTQKVTAVRTVGDAIALVRELA